MQVAFVRASCAEVFLFCLGRYSVGIGRIVAGNGRKVF